MGSALYSLGHQMDYLNLVYGSLRPLLDQILFSCEAKKWTQLKLEPALLFSIAFTHKLRIPEAITWTHHCIHAQDAYIPEAVTWTQLSFTHKMRIFLRPTSGLICTIRNLLFNLDHKYHYTYKTTAAKSILSQITKKLDSRNRQV